jgi:amino acid adenylation domain-containing protein
MFDGPVVDALWESFVGFLGTLLARPVEALRHLPLVPEPDQQRVRTLGHRVLDFDPTVRVHHLIERHAARTPDRVCLSSDGDVRTFAQLNSRANRLARYFVDELRVRPGEIVALVMDRSILIVESILALWKCGAAYLPINPEYPPPYVRSLVQSSRVRLVAVDPSRTSPDTRASIDGIGRVVELGAATGADRPDGNLDLDLDGASLAYLIYTSGSTGAPKGAMVEHAGMLNHLHAKIADLSLSARSVVVHNASSSFDISVWQMFAAPMVGGRTVIYGPALQMDPLRLGSRLDTDRVTVLQVVPSYLETMLDSWEDAGQRLRLDCLEFLVVTGDVALPRLYNRWLRRYPNIPAVNAYGPTEASDGATHHVVAEVVETGTVPLGLPLPNIYIYVLDKHLRLCPPGVRGEIYLSGISVGRGYLNAPGQTARAFTTDPFEPQWRMYRTGDHGRWSLEGTLEYLGRADSQVKVRGFRVGLGEIERRVSACRGVKSAAVVLAAGTDDRLCAYVVLEPGGSVAECRRQLGQELPSYMVPANIVELDRLPLNSNGKTDRRALRAMEIPRTRPMSSQVPRDETERAVAAIWEEVLDVDDAGVTDRFFDTGGTSLRAVQLLSRIRTRLGVELPIEALFAEPTIAGLASLVSAVRPPAVPDRGRA